MRRSHSKNDLAVFDGTSYSPVSGPSGLKLQTSIASRVLVEHFLLIPHEAGLCPPQPPPARARCCFRGLSRYNSELKPNGQELIAGLQILVVAPPHWQLTLQDRRKFETLLESRRAGFIRRTIWRLLMARVFLLFHALWA